MASLLQIQTKASLLEIAAQLTAISLPAGSTESAITLQLERWYQMLDTVVLPDETIFTSPALPATPVSASPAPQAAALDIQALAKAVAPLLAVIPGGGGPVAAAVATAVANAPLPKLSTSATPTPAPASAS